MRRRDGVGSEDAGDKPAVVVANALARTGVDPPPPPPTRRFGTDGIVNRADGAPAFTGVDRDVSGGVASADAIVGAALEFMSGRMGGIWIVGPAAAAAAALALVFEVAACFVFLRFERTGCPRFLFVPPPLFPLPLLFMDDESPPTCDDFDFVFLDLLAELAVEAEEEEEEDDEDDLDAALPFFLLPKDEEDAAATTGMAQEGVGAAVNDDDDGAVFSPSLEAASAGDAADIDAELLTTSANLAILNN